MTPPEAVRHVPLSRAYSRLEGYLQENESYEVSGENESTLNATREDGRMVLEVSQSGHVMRFRWTDRMQDPFPIHISMDFAPVVRAVTEEADRLYLVLLRSSGEVFDRFPLPPE